MIVPRLLGIKGAGFDVGAKGFDGVDVAPLWKQRHFESKGCGFLLGQGRHVLGQPRNFREELVGCSREAEIVSAIGGHDFEER